MEPPPEAEQRRILARLHPQLAPLLPHTMDTLALVRAAYGQQQHGQALSEAVTAALDAAGIATGGGSTFGFSVGRHFSIRDVLKWCRRMGRVRGVKVGKLCRGLAQLGPACVPPRLPSSPAVQQYTFRTCPHLPLFCVPCLLLQLHAALLQRSLKPNRSAQYRASVAAVPVAVREAAFIEAADCFCALLGRAEVRDAAQGMRICRAWKAL